MTAISEFYIDVRTLAHDFDQANPNLEDAVIASGVKLTVRSGRLSGYAVSGSSISPDVNNPNHYFLIAAWTAKLLRGGESDSYSSRTRPHSYSVGGNKMALAELDEWITKANSGAMFSGWSSYLSWLEGQQGIPSLWLHMVEMRVGKPFGSVSLNADGISGQTL